MIITKSQVAAAVGLLMTSGAFAGEREVSFSYSFGDSNYEYVGTKKAETYDVAIRITDPTLTGAAIRSFRVPVPAECDASGISDISVWVTGELTLVNKVNVPDMLSVPASVTDGIISVEFDDRVIIPEGGAYVGYTFTVISGGASGLSEAYCYPVCLAGSPAGDGMYIHTSRTYLKWKSMADSYGHSSAITVGLEGDFSANALGVVSLGEGYAVPGGAVTVNASLVNHGSDPLTGFEYTVSDGDDIRTESVTLPEQLSLSYGEVFSVPLVFDAPETIGEYGLDIEITKINGSVNSDPGRGSATTLWVFEKLPVHRPLVEEYTGLWCGWCPSGYVVLDMMKDRYPEDFVAVAYHNGDVMERLPLSGFPAVVSGFPAAFIDRTDGISPMNSVIAGQGFEFGSVWSRIHDRFSPAFIDGSAEEMADGSVTVRSEISYVRDLDGSHKVAYVIIANGLTDETWAQANSYSGINAEEFIPEMERFCNGDKRITGLVFDDVFAAGSDLSGEPGSIMSDIVAGQVYAYEYTFAPGSGMNTGGNYDIFAHAASLDAVIILLDEDGAVVNCTRIPVEGHSAVADIGFDIRPVKTEYYDLNGRRIKAASSSGVFIRIDIGEDGVRRISKQTVRP